MLAQLTVRSMLDLPDSIPVPGHVGQMPWCQFHAEHCTLLEQLAASLRQLGAPQRSAVKIKAHQPGIKGRVLVRLLISIEK